MTETDPKLAPGWRASRVLGCLQRREKTQIVDFLAERHNARFFTPMERLLAFPRSTASGGHGFGYGFAVMALCSLLIETIYSYWDGLPSTNQRELKELEKHSTPPEYSVSRHEWPRNNADVFKRFFENPLFAPFFPDVNPYEFCMNIRNGLLHQAQTKGGWLLEQSGLLWDNSDRSINRRLFAEAVRDAFHKYIETLRMKDWDDELWRKARRKVWWLIELSKPSEGSPLS